ncbi:flavin-containing monooxygenase [Nocardiopsis alkaliphila]|uniref:flavin-containing monooxygenase n=1 Tax=Nocardiopsis alkaliphila TaxID=225762 RepID=UPI00034C1444|nr:NAD(P)-binding domain-containing protein [Nocardiopsis alkaliphila]
MRNPPRVAVIGAGAAGLAALKTLVDVGVRPVGYDKGDRPGGLWVQDNSSGLSAAYSSLHLNTSKKRTEFVDFPMPSTWPDYPSAKMIAGYLADYARTFDLNRHVRYGSTVVSVERQGPGEWFVVTEDGATDRFDAVVVANGHNWDPRWPDPAYPGTFEGRQMHAHDYRDAETFRDKRVMVVGMGNSAMDITVDASQVSRGPVLLSARRGVHVVPKYLFGRPSDATGGAIAVLPWRVRQALAQTMVRLSVGDPTRYGLPAPASGLFQDHPTLSDTIHHRLTHGEVVPRPGIERFDGDRVVFTDGRSDRVDLVVWATGYRVSIPFLSERWLGPAPEEMPLYKRVFHLEDPSLTFIGLMQSTGAALPVVEAQAKLAATHLAGLYALPGLVEQRRSVRRAHRDAVRRWGDRRPMMRIDFDRYVADLPREIAIGVRRARNRPEARTGVRRVSKPSAALDLPQKETTP